MEFYKRFIFIILRTETHSWTFLSYLLLKLTSLTLSVSKPEHFAELDLTKLQRTVVCFGFEIVSCEMCDLRYILDITPVSSHISIMLQGALAKNARKRKHARTG